MFFWRTLLLVSSWTVFSLLGDASSRGYTPALSIEITRECPLRCPGCYAYGDDHLGGDVTLREVRDFKGQELVDGIIALVDRHRPLHVSIVGGEPLVRYKELNHDSADARGARHPRAARHQRRARDSAANGTACRRLSIVVSIDGLQPEHDVATRRRPPTIASCKHIVGHSITVHCTVTRQQVNRPGYIEEFLKFWSAQRRSREDLDQPLHAAGRRGVGGAAASGRPRAGRRRSARAAAEVSEAETAEGTDRGLRRTAALAGRLRVRADDHDDLGRPDDARSRRASSAARRTATIAAASPRPALPRSGATTSSGSFRSARSSPDRCKVGEQVRRMRPVEPSAA